MRCYNTRILMLASGLTVAVFLSSCRSVPPQRQVNEASPWLTEGGQRPRVALVLSGGASKGFAHVGAIRVLEQEKIPVDFIVGTSVGSLIGALYASTKSSFELEWLSFDLKEEDLFDFTIMSPTQGFVRGERLVKFVQAKVGDTRLQDLKIPLYVTATDLQTGELVVFSTGPVARAIRASSSIPVVFPPVIIDGRQFVDGGVVDNLPADIARRLGADIVIAVDISEVPEARDLTNIKDYAMQSITIMMALTSRATLGYADVVIRPEVSGVGMWDFSKKKELLVYGMEATNKKLPDIRAVFRKWYETKGACAR